MSAALQHFKRKFPVSWTTLLAGWRGLGQMGRLVTTSDVAEFASEQLESTPGANSILAELATASELETGRVESYLVQLASADQKDYQTEERKWIITLLGTQLDELPNDPLYGLLQLTEFWAALDFPDYSPHEVQGKGNALSPKEYYTQENFAKAVQEHKRWLEQESLNLSGAPSSKSSATNL